MGHARPRAVPEILGAGYPFSVPGISGAPTKPVRHARTGGMPHFKFMLERMDANARDQKKSHMVAMVALLAAVGNVATGHPVYIAVCL